MDKLTDLEICKRIAEIEGVLKFTYEKPLYGGAEPMSTEALVPSYNPLTDDAINLRLRDKYYVEINYDGYCMIYDETHDCIISEVEWGFVRDINKSVLLVIIKDHEAN